MKEMEKVRVRNELLLDFKFRFELFALFTLEYRETRTETTFKTSHQKQSDIYQIEKKILSKIRKINTHASDIRDMLFMPLLKLCTFYILH